MATGDSRSFDYVMSFVSNSRRFKDQFVDRWREVLANFIVDPEDLGSDSISQPYGKSRRMGSYRPRGVILKDAETHKVIMTYASQLALTIFGDRRGEYIQATPIGWEDAGVKGPTVTRLMRYAFGLPGYFRTMVEAIVDMLLFGTSVVEINWKYQEREQLIRSVSSVGGVVEDDFTRGTVVSYNDPLISVVDNQNFYPDPANHRIEDMVGVAKKFQTTAMEARAMAAGDIWREKAVEEAIAAKGEPLEKTRSGDNTSERAEMFREGLDQPWYKNRVDDFTPMVGFEYWGEVPWADNKGSSRRVITVVNATVVRDDPYPLADPDLPFRSLTINPVQGRFYGVSPAEVIRWDQSLQDAVKILLAEAIIRSVHPPIAYDMDSEIDVNLLRRWQPDAPMAVRGGPSSVGVVKYDANVFAGFQQAAANKQDMQEASGALGIIQGQGLQNNRASATEAGFTAQQALNRPELAAALLEKDAMPNIARSVLRRYQQFLEDDEELKMRVGEQPESIWVGDIFGDFDIQFVGSRMAMSRQEQLQSLDRLVAFAAAVPQAGMMIPWMDFLKNMIGDMLELPEVAAKMGDPQTIALNVLLQQAAAAGTGNGNGTSPAAAPAGQLPAQASGNVG